MVGGGGVGRGQGRDKGQAQMHVAWPSVHPRHHPPSNPPAPGPAATRPPPPPTHPPAPAPRRHRGGGERGGADGCGGARRPDGHVQLPAHGGGAQRADQAAGARRHRALRPHRRRVHGCGVGGGGGGAPPRGVCVCCVDGERRHWLAQGAAGLAGRCWAVLGASPQCAQPSLPAHSPVGTRPRHSRPSCPQRTASSLRRARWHTTARRLRGLEGSTPTRRCR